MYFDQHFNNCVYQMPRIFPNAKADNLVIMVKQRPAEVGHLALMLNCPPEMQTDGGSQCFPLYLYEKFDQREDDNDLLSQEDSACEQRRYAITDEGLDHFQSAYPGEPISKEDIFYYVYGILHSVDYRERFAANLGKELPRIPAVKQACDFWALSNAGRDLARLHLNYETVEPYPLTIETTGKLTDVDYRVEKMKHAKVKDPETGKRVNDLATVIYNHRITLRDIPLEAWDYVVNGKPALTWVMERQCVKIDKSSGIVNDANDWAIETMNNPKYPMELFQRVVTVSLETQKIVDALPPLDLPANNISSTEPQLQNL